MTYIYIASKPPGKLLPEVNGVDADDCRCKLMDAEGKTWEWLSAHGYTVDRYEVGEQ